VTRRTADTGDPDAGVAVTRTDSRILDRRASALRPRRLSGTSSVSGPGCAPRRTAEPSLRPPARSRTRTVVPPLGMFSRDVGGT